MKEESTYYDIIYGWPQTAKLSYSPWKYKPKLNTCFIEKIPKLSTLKTYSDIKKVNRLSKETLKINFFPNIGLKSTCVYNSKHF